MAVAPVTGGAESVPLRLVTLGRLEASAPGATGSLVVQPKRLALLAYLALTTTEGATGGPAAGAKHRDAILALFWPALSPDEGRRALRQALFYLRRIFGRDAIVSRPDGAVAIGATTVWCDAVAFESARAAGRLEEAVALYAGEFLAGVEVAEVGPGWGQWVAETRARLREEAAQAAWALAQGRGSVPPMMEAPPPPGPGLLHRIFRWIPGLTWRSKPLT